MRGNSKINHKPYFPPTFFGEEKKPYICRIAPFEDGFEFEWFDKSPANAHTLYYGKRGSEEKNAVAISDSVVHVAQLEANCDYEFYIESEDGRRSNLRLVRTAKPPADTTVINYLHPEDGQYDFSGNYLCSPSIARVKSGRLIASMDVYGERTAQNLIIMFYSDDDGAHWHYLTDLYPFYWGSLFYHHDVLYILGLTTEYGNLQIACSKDEGETWSEPVTLFFGSNSVCKYGGMHRAPMHLTSHNGRLYTSCEYGGWTLRSFLPATLSIDENDDPMVAENWVRSDFLPFDGEWKKAAADGKQGDTIEGNLVLAPDGNLYNIMRWRVGSLLKLKVSVDDPEAAPEFVSIDEAPVTDSMFRIIPHEGEFIMLTNRRTEASQKYDFASSRTVLSICKTRDLKNFTVVKDIVNQETEDPKKIGFQYPCFLKEGNRLSIIIRSAFNNANTFHDTNYMLFYRTEI